VKRIEGSGLTEISEKKVPSRGGRWRGRKVNGSYQKNRQGRKEPSAMSAKRKRVLICRGGGILEECPVYVGGKEPLFNTKPRKSGGMIKGKMLDSL